MPRIKTTRTVNIALFVLRIYLVGMLVLILAKFVLEARHGPASKPAKAAASQASDPVHRQVGDYDSRRLARVLPSPLVGEHPEGTRG